ncbi:hypothetical protein YTPLAS18_30750 [Nitrospira sp.]|nr:hypothetical protein YTPLAS18_30750 [Nitrospira sp.]
MAQSAMARARPAGHGNNPAASRTAVTNQYHQLRSWIVVMPGLLPFCQLLMHHPYSTIGATSADYLEPQ